MLVIYSFLAFWTPLRGGHSIVHSHHMDEAGPYTSRSLGATSVSPPSSTGSTKATPSIGRPRRSLVWDYFDYDPVADKSVCQVLSTSSQNSDAIVICGSSVSGKFPTNLRQHLKRCHTAQFSELVLKEESEKKEKQRIEQARRATSLKASQQLTSLQQRE